MNNDNVKKLLEVTREGTLEDVKAAFEACSVNERARYMQDALCLAVKNHSPYALDIVRFLMGKRININFNILYNAVRNTGPCALEIAKFMMKRSANPHEKNSFGDTAFTLALRWENTVVADYLLSRDGFLLSDLMPCPEYILADTYKAYREKAISRVSESIYANGIPYARTIAADIEKILKTERPKPTQEDIEALQLFAKKIASKDWVVNAKVSSSDFDFPGTER